MTTEEKTKTARVIFRMFRGEVIALFPDVSPYLADLPRIIEEPGEYVTRSGARVTIREIDSRPEFIARGFAAKGTRWRMFRGKVRPHGADIWHVSGRYKGVGESARDIVGKYRHEC